MNKNKTARQLFIAPKYDAGFLAITKCGSTFLKHLFWRLNFGEEFAGALHIHGSDDVQLRGDDLAIAHIRDADTYFVAVRNPVDRFVSLYFDKFQEPVPKSAPTNRFRRLIAGQEQFDWHAETLEQHRINMHLAIAALEHSLSCGDKSLQNPHWAPQFGRIDRLARPMRLVAMTVDGLNDQLTTVLGRNIPEIGALITQVKSRNSGRKKPQGPLVDDDLRRKILQLYARDHDIWADVSQRWADWQANGRDPGLVPRFSD